MRLRLLDRWKLWRWRTAGLVVTEQACRRCGYAVRGLETMTCPECGADRYHVGTIGPLRPLVQRWQAAVALWWIAVIVFAIAADPLLLNCLPRTLTYQEDYVLQPHSKLYGPLPFRRIGHSFGWPGLGPYAKSPSVVGTSATLINIPAFGEQFETVIDIDPQTKRGGYSASYIRPNRRRNRQPPQQGTVNAEFFQAWMARMNFDATRVKPRAGGAIDKAILDAEAAELAQFALAPTFDPQAYQALRHFDVTAKQTRSSGEVHPDAATALRIIIWGTIGMIGTRMLRRRLRSNRA